MECWRWQRATTPRAVARCSHHGQQSRATDKRSNKTTVRYSHPKVSPNIWTLIRSRRWCTERSNLSLWWGNLIARRHPHIPEQGAQPMTHWYCFTFIIAARATNWPHIAEFPNGPLEVLTSDDHCIVEDSNLRIILWWGRRLCFAFAALFAVQANRYLQRRILSIERIISKILPLLINFVSPACSPARRYL